MAVFSTFVLTIFTVLYIGPPEAYKWKNRIIIIFAKDRDSGFYVEQVNNLDENSIEFKERDLVSYHIFDLNGIGPDNQYLEKADLLHLKNHYNFDQGPFKLLLIGKDGTVKLERSEPVTSTEIYRLIDSMPMRQIEIQRRKNSP
jgi:hypothetical protein